MQLQRPKLVARMWRDRNAKNDRRTGTGRQRRRDGPERRRVERRGPRWFTPEELERMVGQATSGKWQGRTRIRSMLEGDADVHRGYVEALDPAFHSRVKVCDVSREADRNLVAAAPELAMQCLCLLDELESAIEARHRHASRSSEARTANKGSSRRRKVLKELYQESLGQRLFLLSVETDDRRFRQITRTAFIAEVRRLKERLGRRRSRPSATEDSPSAERHRDENEA
jgi:hypothetical protein